MSGADTQTDAEKILISGNEAIGEGAIRAGVRFYGGYPITPQNDLTAYMADQLPLRGGQFVQAESEIAAINMLYGASAAGVTQGFWAFAAIYALSMSLLLLTVPLGSNSGAVNGMLVGISVVLLFSVCVVSYRILSPLPVTRPGVLVFIAATAPTSVFFAWTR